MSSDWIELGVGYDKRRIHFLLGYLDWMDLFGRAFTYPWEMEDLASSSDRTFSFGVGIGIGIGISCLHYIFFALNTKGVGNDWNRNFELGFIYLFYYLVFII